jgi:hypothetical protein
MAPEWLGECLRIATCKSKLERCHYPRDRWARCKPIGGDFRMGRKDPVSVREGCLALGSVEIEERGCGGDIALRETGGRARDKVVEADWIESPRT